MQIVDHEGMGVVPVNVTPTVVMTFREMRMVGREIGMRVLDDFRIVG